MSPGRRGPAERRRLALFDLDGTLLVGDTDELWCEFLVGEGLIDPAYRDANQAVDAAYATGSIAAEDYCRFYCGLLAGHGDDWLPRRRDFVERVTQPRLAPRAHALVDAHRAAGDRLVLTTATNRFLAEAVAESFGFAEVIATEPERGTDGLFTGRLVGMANMREGKVHRFHAWAAAQGLDPIAALAGASFYSDSANDLSLLLAVARPVAVDPEPRLAAEASSRGWAVLSLRGA